MKYHQKGQLGIFSSVWPVNLSFYRKLLFFIFFLAVLLSAFHTYADELPFFISLDSSEYERGDPLPIDAVSIFERENAFYLFIPSGWDCKRLRIISENGDDLSLDGKTYRSGDEVSIHPNSEIELSIGESAWTASVVQSGIIPAVFITTDSHSIAYISKSKENRESGACKILNADASVEYNGQLEHIRIRGQSTAAYPKKPFQIKLSKSASLFGMEKEKNGCYWPIMRTNP